MESRGVRRLETLLTKLIYFFSFIGSGNTKVFLPTTTETREEGVRRGAECGYNKTSF